MENRHRGHQADQRARKNEHASELARHHKDKAKGKASEGSRRAVAKRLTEAANSAN
jgi:hypothetical protein